MQGGREEQSESWAGLLSRQLAQATGDSDGKTICSVSFSSSSALGEQESVIRPLKSQRLAKMALRDICQINQKQMSTSYADLLNTQQKLTDLFSLPLLILESQSSHLHTALFTEPIHKDWSCRKIQSKSE